MPWKQTSPTRYQRPFDSLERMYRTISAAGQPLNREHFAITASLRLHFSSQISDPAPALRTAWKRLRYEYPHIAAYGSGDAYVYDVPRTDADVEAWLDETFIVVEAAGAEVVEVRSELARLFYFPATAEVVFRSSHWRIDGIGTCHLLNRLLALLADSREREAAVQFGDEWKNLCVGLDEAIGAVASDFVTPEMEQAATDILMGYVNNLPTIGLPVQRDGSACGSARCGIKLSSQLTSAVVARCKDLGLSVTTAVHAAIVCATDAERYGNLPSTTKKYTSWSTFDLRRYLPAPYNGAIHAVSIFHTGIPITITPSNFLETATQLRAIYTQDLRLPIPGGAGNLFNFLPRYVDKVTTILTQPPPPGISPPTDPALSNFGRH